MKSAIHLAVVRLLSASAAAVLCRAAIAAVPLAWDARPGTPAPASFDRFHGETLELRCTFRGFGELPFAAGADVRLWYQTNGMGAAWWSAPATIQSNVLSATWSPALDPGADRVSLFFGAPSNAYASAVLRLRHSPGFTPSAQPIPVQVFDFGGFDVRNAPYYTRAEADGCVAGAISTNNPAFVSAVLAAPLAGADASDLAELAEYGGYGTVGAALLALIAGLAALKRRVAGKAEIADLRYALVTPGFTDWQFGGVPSGWTASVEEDDAAVYLIIRENGGDGYYEHSFDLATYTTLSADLGGSTVVATRSYALADRAGNRVVIAGDATLTLPAAITGYARDFIVRLEISGTVPTITFAAPTGEEITYETEGDEFPLPDAAGTWVYSFTENCVAHTVAVALKKVNTVAVPQAQGGL